METFKISEMKKTTTYKTNIKCNGCIATVTPFLEKSKNIDNWKVDLESSDRIMTVELKEDDHGEIENLIKEAGYQATRIN